MKSIFFRGNQYPVELKELPKPLIEKGKVLIRIDFASINHLDLWIIKEEAGTAGKGVILGSDGSGLIEAVGDEVSNWTKGQEVIINPVLNWGNNMKFHGPEFEILGYPTNGTFSNYLLIDQEQLFPKPAHLSLQEAAAIPMAALTAYRALFTRGELKKGQNVLITGTGGGVAQFLLQIAKAAGANVYVTSGNEEKIAFALKEGAIQAFNYNEKDWALNAKEAVSEGFDLIVDGAGGEGFYSLITLAKAGGTIVSYGRTKGNIPSISPRLLFNKQLNIHGTLMGSPNEFKNMLDFYEQHSLHPIIDKIYLLEDFMKAFERMTLGNHMGKILLKIGE